jgi:hypothetical protein
MLVINEVKRMKQEDHMFEASLGYFLRLVERLQVVEGRLAA